MDFVLRHQAVVLHTIGGILQLVDVGRHALKCHLLPAHRGLDANHWVKHPPTDDSVWALEAVVDDGVVDNGQRAPHLERDATVAVDKRFAPKIMVMMWFR